MTELGGSGVVSSVYKFRRLSGAPFALRALKR